MAQSSSAVDDASASAVFVWGQKTKGARLAGAARARNEALVPSAQDSLSPKGIDQVFSDDGNL